MVREGLGKYVKKKKKKVKIAIIDNTTHHPSG